MDEEDLRFRDRDFNDSQQEPFFSLTGTGTTSCSCYTDQDQEAVPQVNLILQNTVERLNRDVDHILARVRLLEAAYAANQELKQTSSNGAGPLRRRSLFSVRGPALALILAWPFVAFFIIKLFKLWLRKRRH